jgi:hypothetical protein
MTTDHDPDDPRDVIMAIIALVDIFLLLCVLSGCGPRRVQPTVVNKTTYTYWQEATDHYIVYLPTSEAEKDAKFELCPVSYVCKITTAGRVVRVERIRK